MAGSLFIAATSHPRAFAPHLFLCSTHWLSSLCKRILGQHPLFPHHISLRMGKQYDGPKFFGLSGTALSRMIGFAAGAGCEWTARVGRARLNFDADIPGRPVLLFGYDQGVMGSLLTLPSFLETFPSIDSTGKSGTSHEATLQGVAIGIYESEWRGEYTLRQHMH